ncbi:MAG: Rossman fold protein, TIGR00730 family [Chromatiales bacterium 21-64-14]|nr:MAG: Rossman fold protein, TIGR00730 family [Chromatiales bacterium 21-64-14]
MNDRRDSSNPPAARARPAPAHPQRRHEPLPWHAPKPAEEDPDAPRRVQAILDSPTYRPADRDVDFLDLGATRGVRLQIDYLKPELLLDRYGVEHTIVVFGSTRIREPAAAQRRVEELLALLRDNPGDTELERRLAVAERLLAKSRYYDAARELGRLIGAAGAGPDDHRVMLVTGGGPGMMEAANRGAFDVRAHSIGLNITLPHEQYPNPYITPELCFRFHYFAIRKLHFLLRARALVAFPGGYGTFDELFETLTLIQTRKIRPVPVILVGERYWRRAVDVDFLVEEGVIDPEDRDLFWYAEDAQEIWQGIVQWHEANGTPLYLGRGIHAPGPAGS